LRLTIYSLISMALFKIYIDRDGLYRFLLKLNTRDIIFISLGFKTSLLCRKSLEVFKASAVTDSAFKRLVAHCGRSYYNFKNINSNQTIGVSELFLNRSFMERQITLIKKNAKDAVIDTCIYTS